MSSRVSATAIQSLSPGYFPFVMATSIISTGTFLQGPSWLSRVLLVIASAGLAVLMVAMVLKLVLFRSSVAAGFRDPGRVFALFAIAAGINVLGIRLAAAGHPLATAILAGVAAVVWLGLTYGVPAGLLARSRDSVLGEVNGTWLLWVVGTQSLSVVASTLVPAWPSQTGLLAPVAVGLWSIGRVCRGVLLRAVGLRHLVDPAAGRARHLAARPAPLAADLRACAVERGLPARDVQRRDGGVRPGCPPRVHGTAEPLHALGGGGCVGGGGRRVRRRAITRWSVPGRATGAAAGPGLSR
jgi:tellurite resistance protein TehA-like permease